jgi:hypothetical protein
MDLPAIFPIPCGQEYRIRIFPVARQEREIVSGGQPGVATKLYTVSGKQTFRPGGQHLFLLALFYFFKLADRNRLGRFDAFAGFLHKAGKT